MIEMLSLVVLMLLLTWLMVLARLQRTDEIEDMPHGPNLEAIDRRARFVAALIELHDRKKRERLQLLRRGLLQ
jgi:hypothetical protein